MVNVNESDGPVGGIVQSVAASWNVPDSSPAMVYYAMTLIFLYPSQSRIHRRLAKSNS